MPFGALDRQALGISLLKACLTRRGIPCDIRYLTFPFAEMIGREEYNWINYEAPYTAFGGDWAFTEALYGPRPEADRAYIDEVLRKQWRMNDATVARYQRIRQLANLFIDYCVQAIPWSQYNLVGFTSTFEQNLASLALARRIKSQWPKLRTVFGGANWEDEMGLEYHRQFPFVDFACGGESEITLPALVECLANRGDLAKVAGLVHRRDGVSVRNGDPERVGSMDDLPLPDFSDYFHDLHNSGVDSEVIPTLLFESSRGCWWGAKSHCTFCGLNGGAMAFRSKSPGRALEELKTLVRTWKVDLVEAVDNILDMGYFREFVPALAASGMDLSMFYEVKANLNRRQLRQMKAAGIHRIQPGIESLSDRVLQLMRKGTTGLKNIQLLKWCKEYAIDAEWNLLYGFPGESREDYGKLLKLLARVRFLHPPTACGPLRLDRFSPYHRSPAQYGLTNIRALATYRHLYPFEESVLSRLAYYFDFDYAPEVDPRGFADDVIRYCAEWKTNPENGSLTMMRRPDGSLGFTDTRATAAWRTLSLSGAEQEAYEYCDEAHSLPSITRRLRDCFPDRRFGDKEVRAFLDSAVDNGMMVAEGDHYLSLALADPQLRGELERRKEERNWIPQLQQPAPQFAILGS
jgi:ribosomal peptide maturation radical SAM protein 1